MWLQRERGGGGENEGGREGGRDGIVREGVVWMKR